jgi:hypothetical protein
MSPPRAGGKNHRIRYIGWAMYEISWQYEMKYASSRILHHRTIVRDTDKKGAERFAKKWGCPMPDDAPGGRQL